MSASAATYKVTLGYRGTHFFGVSPQPDGRTVCSELTTALTRCFSQPPVALAWAARTDRGVHAVANVFSFRLREPVPASTVLTRLRSDLPADVTLHAVSEMPRSFHARASAKAKHYRYRVWVGNAVPSTERVWQAEVPLDLARMQALAQWLTGTRDWSALRHPRCSARTPVKTMERVSVRARSGKRGTLYVLDVVGVAFLRQMVRRLAGTLCSVGAGWLTLEAAQRAIVDGKREDAGPAAPAHGLTLMRVEY